MTTAVLDDRPPATQGDDVDQYAVEQGRQTEADVLAGLRAMDRAEGVQWNVYRINDPEESRNGWLAKWGTAQLTYEHIRNKFGPGAYRVRGHYPNGTFATQRDILIAGDAPMTGKNPVQISEVSPAHAPDSSIKDFLLLIQQQDSQRRADEAARRDADRDFWRNLIATTVPAIAPVLVSLLKPAAPASGLKELIEAQVALKGLDPPKKEGGIKDMLETLALLRDFDGESRKGPGEKGIWDALTELAKSAGPKLGTILEAVQSRAAQSAGGFISSPQPSGVPAGLPVLLPATATGHGSVLPAADESESTILSSQPPLTGQRPISQTLSQTNGAEQSDMNLMMIRLLPFLRQQTAFLVQKAARNSEPGLYAELMLDNLPAGVSASALTDFLKRDDWWSLLCNFDANVTPYAGWFEQLRNELIDLTTEKTNDSDHPDTAS